MKETGKTIIPVLLGGDLNAYSVALAFREAYGVTSHAFVRYRCGATENSDFIITHICSELDNVEIAVAELLKFAWEHGENELYLIPCSDIYVEIAEEGKAALEGYYRIHVPSKEMREELSDKCSFMMAMEKAGIACPKYVVFSKEEVISDKKLSEISYPAVLKPSNSAKYWANPFPKMKKVYFPQNKIQAFDTIYKIFGAGYSEKLILQNRVGGEEINYVLTTFSDGTGKVVRAVLGEVVLEECGETSQGNHSAIITIPLDNISYRLIEFLNEIGYVGFANFDIMSSGKKKYVLELNTRQGRSCDYMRCAGVNIANLLVKCARGEKIKADFNYKEIYWHYPSNRLVKMYAKKFSKRIRSLLKNGNSYSPYENSYEGLKRKIYVAIHNLRLSEAFRKSFLKKDT